MLFTSFCRCEKFQFSTCWQHLFRGDCGHFFTCEIPHFYILRRCQTGSEKRSLEGLLKMSSPLSSNVFQMWKRCQAPSIQCFSHVEKMSSPLPSNVFHMWRRYQAPYHPMFFRCGEDVKLPLPISIHPFNSTHPMINCSRFYFLSPNPKCINPSGIPP